MEEYQNIKSEENSKVPKWLHWENALGMLAAGLGLGWIIGMANNPIIKDVILAFVAVITTVMGLMAGFGNSGGLKDGIFSIFTGTNKAIETEENQKNIAPKAVRILPIGLFLLFLALGAGLGLFTKNSFWLVPDYKKMSAELGIPDSVFLKKYNRQIFESRLGSKTESLTIMDSLQIYQTFELLYGKADNENKSLIEKITKINRSEKKTTRQNSSPQTGLNSGKLVNNECKDVSRLSADMLKDWLLKKVKVADKTRIEAIDISEERKLKAELFKICPTLN